MKTRYLIFIVLLLLLQINVKAETCSNDEFKRLKNLADKVEFTYDYEWETFYYDEENDDTYRRANFTITATNLNDQLKVMVEENFLLGKYKEFVNNGSGIGSLNNFWEGSKVKITIRAFTDNECAGKILKTATVNLPSLNLTYNNNIDVCNSYPNFKYCRQFLDEKIDDLS